MHWGNFVLNWLSNARFVTFYLFLLYFPWNEECLFGNPFSCILSFIYLHKQISNWGTVWIQGAQEWNRDSLLILELIVILLVIHRNNGLLFIVPSTAKKSAVVIRTHCKGSRSCIGVWGQVARQLDLRRITCEERRGRVSVCLRNQQILETVLSISGNFSWHILKLC